MSSVYFSKIEQNHMDAAQRYTTNERTLTPDTMPATRIACVRYFMSVIGAAKESDAYKHLLCKLIYDAQLKGHPEWVTAYIVTKDRRQFHKIPAIEQLAMKYLAYVHSSGFGYWASSRFESAIYTISGADSTGPGIIHRASVRELLAVYDEQARTAAQASGKEGLSIETFGSVTDRRAASEDTKGKCFRCGAPKIRQRMCGVCGYKPRSAS